MSGLRIRKLYVDAIDEEGTAWITYFVELRWGAWRRQTVAVEMYPATGDATIRRALAPVPWPEPPAAAADSLEFRVRLPDGIFAYSGLARLPPWRPEASRVPFAWHVVRPRLEVALQRPGSARACCATGYADVVELRGPPRASGIRELHWGRAHGADGTIVFTSVAMRDGAAWQRSAQWNATGQRVTSEELTVQTADRATQLDWGGEAGGTFLFGRERVLHDASAADPVRVPNPFERLMYRLLLGPTRDVRWLGSARWPGAADVRGRAIHERVQFG